jgi:hypothetical protein
VGRCLVLGELVVCERLAGGGGGGRGTGSQLAAARIREHFYVKVCGSGLHSSCVCQQASCNIQFVAFQTRGCGAWRVARRSEQRQSKNAALCGGGHHLVSVYAMRHSVLCDTV